LESYHPYLLPQEVSKTPTTLGTYGSLPKIRKGRFGSLRPLGVNKDIKTRIPYMYSIFMYAYIYPLVFNIYSKYIFMFFYYK
jgi:hypothetical protein